MTASEEQSNRPVLDDLGRPASGARAARRGNWLEIAAAGAIMCAIVPCVLAATRQPDHYLPLPLTVIGLVTAYLAMIVSCGIVIPQLRRHGAEQVRPAILMGTVACVVAMLGLG